MYVQMVHLFFVDLKLLGHANLISLVMHSVKHIFSICLILVTTLLESDPNSEMLRGVCVCVLECVV